MSEIDESSIPTNCQAFCEVCGHGVYNMEKHIQTEDHRRNAKKCGMKVCPYGISARHCEYQETRAKDLLSTIEGELVFLCKLDKLEDCPFMKKLLEGVIEDKNDTS